jgi:hypothetical protein
MVELVKFKEIRMSEEEWVKETQRQMDEFNNLPKEFVLQAEVDMLRERIHKIGKLSQTNVREFINGPRNSELEKLKHELFEMTDMVFLNVSDVLQKWKEKNKS